ncbi:MAG: lysoplasmalogenase [Bacteroidetes bacterium]|nr:lysoplasmalogenase [Bacteroidota bacterium]
MNRSRLILSSFTLISAAAIVTLFFDLPSAFALLKPLILPALTAYYVARAESRMNLFVVALFFCWLGDVLLIFQPSGEIFFLLGLVAFLTGHLLYIAAYRKLQWQQVTNALLRLQRIRWSFPVLLAGTGLVTILFPTLGPMKIPVLIYAIVLMGMVMAAIFRWGRTNERSFWWLLAGAVLFMVSDSLLAVNKFHSPFPRSGVAVMGTYIMGQYGIVRGVLLHSQEPVSTQTP